MLDPGMAAGEWPPDNSTRRFRYRARQLIFTRGVLNRVVARLAKRWPARYEQRWAWLFPAWFIYVELAVVKPPHHDDGEG